MGEGVEVPDVDAPPPEPVTVTVIEADTPVSE
jgi:hypothetical protein